jgi:hypothetical protein
VLKTSENDAPAASVGVSADSAPPPCNFKHGEDVTCKGKERFRVWLADHPQTNTVCCKRAAYALQERYRKQGIKVFVELVWPRP